MSHYDQSFFLIVFLGVGVVFAFQYYRSYHARKWPRKTAVVICSETASSYSESFGRSYKPKIRYEYEVDGARYTSDRIKPISVFISGVGSSFADKVVRKYPKGALIEISYNPENPSCAYIEPRISTTTSIFLLVLTGLSFGLARYFQ